MPELWFFAGLAMGIALAGLVAVGSFERGVDSVRNKTWHRELVARRQVTRLSRSTRRTDAA